MPHIWAYELEKRIRAGTLSREDAQGILTTAVLGAEAQGFKPTGSTMSAVHNSAVDFLGKAESVYFARKKRAAAGEGAKEPTKDPASKGVDPNKAAKDVLPGSLKREFPGQYLDKSLNEVKDLLRTATGKEKRSLQKAKKFLENMDRLMGD